MFDFDGTLALVRAGWMPIMLDMMMETLGPLGNDNAALRAEAEAYVARLTGRDTVHQMRAFADHVRSLGGSDTPGEVYRDEFFRRLAGRVSKRLKAVEQGTAPEESLLVPGVRIFLEALRERGLQIYLASGTAHADIVRECRLLKVEGYFDGIYGSAPENFSKSELLAHIVESGIAPDEILTFGDGRVEIEVTAAAGGVSVGMATDEPHCLVVDRKKRAWLIEAGADYIAPNFLDLEGMLEIAAGTR